MKKMPYLVLIVISVAALLVATGKLDLYNNNQAQANQNGQDPPATEKEVLQANVATPTKTATPVPTVAPTPMPTVTPVSEPGPDSFHYGISLLYGFGATTGDDLLPRIQKLLDYLVGAGIDHLSINFPVFQDNWQSSNVHIDPDNTPSDASMILLVREANLRGIATMIRPILDEKSFLADDKWKGVIEPLDRNAWFKSYGDILVHYATIAAQTGVDSISIGAEFQSLENETEQWLNIIERIKQVYTGQLTYGVNWAQPFTIGFADKLDFVGIDAYFVLDADADASYDKVASEWAKYVPFFDGARDVYGKPFVIEEIGFRSEYVDYREPWHWGDQWGRVAPQSTANQATYYKAACNTLKDHVNGYYWWFVELDFPADPLTDTGWTPLGKPAETELKSCYESARSQGR